MDAVDKKGNARAAAAAEEAAPPLGDTGADEVAARLADNPRGRGRRPISSHRVVQGLRRLGRSSTSLAETNQNRKPLFGSPIPHRRCQTRVPNVRFDLNEAWQCL